MQYLTMILYTPHKNRWRNGKADIVVNKLFLQLKIDEALT